MLKNLINMIRLEVLKTYRLKMKHIIEQIENCIITRVLAKTPHVHTINGIQSISYTHGENLFQVKCHISLINGYGFELTIDFHDVTKIQYVYENINIKDGDVIMETMSSFVTNLNANKRDIEGLIKSYHAIREKMNYDSQQPK